MSNRTSALEHHLVKNYCRTPSGTKPWCYTTDPSIEKEDCHPIHPERIYLENVSVSSEVKTQDQLFQVSSVFDDSSTHTLDGGKNREAPHFYKATFIKRSDGAKWLITKV